MASRVGARAFSNALFRVIRAPVVCVKFLFRSSVCQTNFTLGMSNDERTVVEKRTLRGLTPKEITTDCRRLSQGHDVFDLLGAHPETNPKAATPRKKSGSTEPTWVKAQEKTFTRWINHCLKDTACSVQNFEKDLQDGVCLIELLQQLTGSKLNRKWYHTPKVHVQKVENMNQAFEFIANEGIPLVSIDPLQIVKGDHKMTLALIYHLISHYHIGANKSLQLKWFNSIIPDANIHNFTTDWKDGRCLSLLVNYFEPGSVELSDSIEPLELIRRAMQVANERLNVPQIIDPEDLNKDKPDDQSVSTYLSFFYCPGSTGERVLLGWWNKTFARHLTNFTTDWHDANVLCEMVDHFVPHSKRNGNARRAMIVAERRLGVERTFTSEDIAKHKVDRLSLMVYVAQFQGLEVQQPYSNEEERIDDAAEIEKEALLSMVLSSLVGQCTKKHQICTVGGDNVFIEYLQADLYEIIEKSDCSADDVERFSTTLNYLIDKCGYTLKATKPSLLHRAAEANNTAIVLKLLLSHDACYAEEFNMENSQRTILHIACQLKSVLRYIYVLAFPDFLTVPDINGYCPIHIACQKNDLQFVSWLFTSVLSKEEVPCATVGIDTSFIEANSAPNVTPPLSFIKSSTLSAANAVRHNVYRIAASNGYSQLLSLLLNVLEVMQDAFEMDVVLTPDYNNTTPIDMAIAHQEPECLKLLLEFLNKHGMLQKVVQDGRFVKCAANVGDANIMKLLVKYGFSQGLEEAIGKVQDQQLKRLLLYYYTQLTSAKAIMETQSDYKKGLTKGQMRWSGAPIEMFSVSWINDWFQAMVSISNAINKTEVAHESLYHLCNIQYLASQCFSYFENGKISNEQLNPNPLIPITMIEITSCSLESVPAELFQLHNLEVLKLSNNCIQELPTALHSSQCIYSSQSLRKLVLDGNKLKTLPEDLSLGLVNSLEHLSVQKNELTELPPGLWVMPHLKTLNLAGNKLSQLHYFSDTNLINDPDFSNRIIEVLEHNSSVAEFESFSDKYSDVKSYLKRLQIFYKTLNKASNGNIMLENFRDWICFITKQRRRLEAPNNESLCELPGVVLNENIETSVLSHLNVSHNLFTVVPNELACLAPHLQQLKMSHNRIESMNLIHCMPPSVMYVHLDHNIIENMAATYAPLPFCLSPCMLMLPHPNYCSHTAHTTLKSLIELQLGCNKLKNFISVNTGVGGSEDFENGSFPQLSILSLEHNELTSVPPSILNLTSLNSLILAHNTGIVSLPSRLGLLSLYCLNLEGLSITRIPKNLIKHRSPKYLLGYLKGIHLGQECYRQMKLMFVGSANAGKTTLLLELTKKGSMVHQRIVQKRVNGKPLSTVGVELGEWEYSPKPNKEKITFMTWDFGGQEEYYATHQCFISHRSLYLVVWDAREGEAGLRNIKTWLENIEAQAHNAPVIVIGTHADCIRNTSALEEAFKRLYVEYNPSSFAYPKIQPHCFFVNSFNSSDMERLRKHIYEFTAEYKTPGAGNDAARTIDEPVPSYYMLLLKIIKSLVKKCNVQNISPIFTKQKYIKEIEQCGFPGTVQDIVEASSFWHDNGIIFHHKGITMEELYCIDPQWLCAMLAKVITVRENNPFHQNGFMHKEDFAMLYNGIYMGTTQSFINGIISIMQSFEVILLLDQQSILIPSLMSQQRENACAITENNDGKLSVQRNTGHVITLITTQKNVLLRHYILPFVPNGFFSRLISRVCASRIIDACKGMFGAFDPWWSCWRDGVCLICNDTEILRIVPVTYPLPGTEAMYMITSSGNEVITRLSGIEVRVVIKSKIYALPISVHKTVGVTSDPLDPICAATWLLQQAIECIDSIFDDWYETFGRKRGFEISTIQQGSPCTACEEKRNAITQATSSEIRGQRYYLFSSQFCAHTVEIKNALRCPIHESTGVSQIAPDLVFGDLPHSMVYDAGAITIGHQLGSGGFGNVFSGTIDRNNIAIKQFMGNDHIPTSVESLAWEKYQQISREARVICRLVHDNILGLVGVATAPLMLLLELAPLGDLKACVERFHKVNVKLNVKTLNSTLIQVAKALDYIHSKKLIFRDLKPGNILVWKYPLPETQWNSDSEVYVKLADYGICQQYTPQGVSGGEGTQPYLPPEAILLDGQQRQNTKLDVYSFGMLMYHLFTFENPFQNDTRSVRKLLEMGKRPSLSFKQCPPSLWLLELMCWCWSEHPYHRPAIKEVLTVLEDGVTSQLVSAFPIMSNTTGMVVSASVIHAPNIQPFSRISGYLHPIGSTKPCKTPAIDIWCACKDVLKRVSCQAFHCDVEDVEPGECISIVSTPHAQVWVSKILLTGGELSIFDAKTYHKVAIWRSENHVRKLLYNSSKDVIVAITRKAIHIFQDVSEDLQPVLSHPIAEDVTEAVLVDFEKEECKLVLWYSAESKLKALKLSPSKSNCKTFRQDESSSITHMEALWEEEGTKLNHIVLSHGSCIEKWAVESRELQTTCKCFDFCCNLYGNNYTKTALILLCKVTALLCWRDVIYVGTEGGVMLALNPVDMTALSAFRATETPIRLLLGALLNPKQERKPHSTQPPTLQGPSDSVEEDKPNVGPNRDPAHTPGSVVISFGERYTGVFKGSNNVPPSLVPPGEPHSNTDHPPYLKLSTAPSCATHMFLWSPTWSKQSDRTCMN